LGCQKIYPPPPPLPPGMVFPPPPPLPEVLENQVDGDELDNSSQDIRDSIDDLISQSSIETSTDLNLPPPPLPPGLDLPPPPPPLPPGLNLYPLLLV